ncbi:MAG: GNAT family N-acetyltransferase [Bauldia sp.]
MPGIEVEVTAGPVDLGGSWNELVGRAAPNVFMDPAGLNAVPAKAFARTHVFTAWDRSTSENRLVGVWALEEKRVARFGPRYLSAPPHAYSFVGSPVVEPAVADEVMRAFLEAIAKHRALPKTLRLKYLDGGASTHASLMRALAARKTYGPVPSERTRPFASKDGGVKRSGSTRKKLRQDWNRLSALGAADYVNERSSDAVALAFEAFLQLEFASWKGEAGSALLCRDKDAAFTRAFIAGLAAEGKASVALLRLDGKPIAAQVLLYCGRFAYTWKIAFDAGFGKYSPGAVLVDKVTEELFAGEVDAIESCSPEGGFMTQMWDGRRKTVDLLVSLAGRPSLALAAVMTRDRVHAALKQTRNRIRAIEWAPDGAALPRLAGNLRLVLVALVSGFWLLAEPADQRPNLESGTPQDRRLLDEALGTRPGDGR